MTSCLTVDWFSLPQCHVPYIYILVLITYMIILGILLIKTWGRIKKLFAEELKENEEYMDIYRSVLAKSDRKLKRIALLSGRIVYNQLKHSTDPLWEDEEVSLKTSEQEMYEMFLTLYTEVNPESDIHRIYFYHALRFILKSTLMTDPYDLRGSRRCKRAESILNCLQSGQTLPQRQNSTILHFLRLPQFVYTHVFLYLVFIIIGLWLYDLYTDL